MVPTGVSEGSLGSPEPQNLSLSPFRAVSPEESYPLATPQEGNSRCGDDHASSIASSQQLSQNLAHDRCSREQTSSLNFHPLRNHSFNECLDSTDSNVYWDSQSHQEHHQVGYY